VQLVLSGNAAAWSLPQGCNGVPVTGIVGKDLTAYADYIRTYVKRYSDQGVRRFSLWNEPNIGYLCPPSQKNHSECGHSSNKIGGQLYARVYKKGYAVVQSLKKAGKIPKTVKILLGELASAQEPHIFAFMDAMVSKGKLEADGFSYHPYQSCTPPTSKAKKNFATKNCNAYTNGISMAADMQKKLKALAKAGKLTVSGTKNKPLPLYMTEFGYFQQCPAASATVGFCKNGIPETLRAKWYIQALEFAQKNGAQEFVLFQFTGVPPGVWNTALLDANLNPTGSYKAIHAWAKSHGYPVL